jgi:hypothetical protein
MKAYLCRNLKLSIERLDETSQIRLCLRNDVSLEEVDLCYDLGDNTLDRRYHLREAMVIGTRRLVSLAVDAGLISDYPGEHTSLKSGNTAVPDPLIICSIDEDYL